MAPAVYRQHHDLMESCCYSFCCPIIGTDWYQITFVTYCYAFVTKGTIPERIRYSGQAPGTGLAKPLVCYQ
jgi:hypothetical protein